MMNSLQQGVLTLLRSGLTGEILPLPQEFDMAQAYRTVCEHQVSTLAYEGALNCGISRSLPEMKQLFQNYCLCLLQNERQIQAVEAVFQAFEMENFEYLTVKGCHLKRLYPKPELRLMGDADVLIHAEQYEKIAALLQQLGYQEKAEGENDNAWISPNLYLEIHRELIAASNQDFYPYFGDGWKRAKRTTGNRYSLSLEDEYIYLLVHFAKHYRNCGIGLRHVTDLWVYRRAYPDLDEAYILRGLEQMRLVEFYQNVRRLIAAWFEDGAQDDITSFMTDIIFNSGAWGKRETSMVSVALRNREMTGSMLLGKMKRIFNGFFPPYSVMWQKYPVLKKAPILLPVFWPVRWIRALLFRRDSLRRQYEELRITDADAVSDYQQALNYVGLDFHFKE